MRLIDADALLEAMKTDVMGGLNYRHFIEEAPTIESKKGEWIGEGDGYADGGIVYDTWYCSNCDHCEEGEELALPNFCPNCGAKMIGEEIDEKSIFCM